jgi:cytochrome P450
VTSAVEPELDPFEDAAHTIVGLVRDPYPELAERRRAAPVHLGPNPVSGETNAMAYSHEAVVTVLRDNETYSSAVYAELMGFLMGHTILEMDEPEHRLHRALVSPAFRTKVLARWEDELVGATVHRLIDGFVADGRADLVRRVTFPFPVQVIARILGLPRDDYARFQRWSLELISLTADFDRAVRASESLKTYFSSIVAARREEPRDDLISDLVTTEFEGHALDDEEIYAFLRLLLPAGAETTFRSSGNLLFGLLTHPEQLEAVRADRSLIPQAMEEALRWEPPLLGIMRVATRDTELCGVPIAAGTPVGVNLGAANRDEDRYRDPDEFDIFRDPQQHVAFGFGPHMCLGMHLARMETRVAVNALLDRLPGLRRDDEAWGRDDVHIRGDVFRSPTSLPVVFDAPSP